MATASIPPNNMILLAALGIGAYWFATRTAQGATLSQSASALFRQQQATAIGPVPSYGNYAQNDNAMWGSVGKLLGTVIEKFSPTNSPNQYQIANAKNSGPNATSGGNYSGDPYSSYADTTPVNPAPQFGSLYDYSQEYWY